MENCPIDFGSITLKEFAEFSKQITDLESSQNDNNNRDTLTRQIFQFIAMWMVFILLIVVYVGTGDLELPDSVLITLITTTTANVLGFGYIVANYLFKKNQPNDKR